MRLVVEDVFVTVKLVVVELIEFKLVIVEEAALIIIAIGVVDGWITN